MLSSMQSGTSCYEWQNGSVALAHPLFRRQGCPTDHPVSHTTDTPGALRSDSRPFGSQQAGLPMWLHPETLVVTPRCLFIDPGMPSWVCVTGDGKAGVTIHGHGHGWWPELLALPFLFSSREVNGPMQRDFNLKRDAKETGTTMLLEACYVLRALATSSLSKKITHLEMKFEVTHKDRWKNVKFNTLLF